MRMKDLQTMHHLLEAGESLVEPRNVNIPPFLAVTIRVEGVGTAVLVISEDAKVLRPVSERGSCIDERVGSANGVRGGQSLQEEAVRGIVGVPPHLFRQRWR